MKKLLIGIILVLSLIIFLVVKSFAQGIAYPELNEIENIESIAKPFLEDSHAHALSIGIIKNGKTEFYNFGSLTAENKNTPTEQNIYEIGSITKTFTATLLVQMVEEGVVKMDDPISTYLPKGICDLEGEKVITLQDLSSHYSGLPRLASNFFPTVTDHSNPYINYNKDHLYEYLKTFKGVDRENRKVDYSNLGVELLGHILGIASGQSYEEMLQERIFKPLEMHNTTITFNENHLKQLVKGHNEMGLITSNWDFPHFGGAGAIRSTTEDMMKYIQAQFDNKTFAKTHTKRLTMGGQSEIGLGWIITPSQNTDEKVVWHNGGTGGYRSFTGFIKSQNLGVIVLNNTPLSVDEIGFLVLDYLVSQAK